MNIYKNNGLLRAISVMIMMIYLVADLTKISQLSTTADILGGTLTIEVNINKYLFGGTMEIMKTKQEPNVIMQF